MVEQTDIERALTQCRAAAAQGYEIARRRLDDAGSMLDEAAAQIDACATELAARSLHSGDAEDNLRSQLASISTELQKVHRAATSLLRERHKRLNTFSVTLFGRTVAGKSTLMEILTRGNGASIGKGAQRTTRDTREYVWRGLSVTDVPGVAAFEGAADEQVAYLAAEQADLVIFLITDDAPQDAEAQHFARIRKMGKPLLLLCNVKTALRDELDIRRLLQRRWLNQDRLQGLVHQFHELADQYAPGPPVPWRPVHLHARFLANQGAYAERRADLLAASLFAAVEEDIIRTVVTRGSLMRVRTFVDGSTVPLQQLCDQLLEFSAKNAMHGRILVGKRRELEGWAQRFQSTALQKISNDIGHQLDALRREVANFAEANFENPHAGTAWQQKVKQAGLSELPARIQAAIGSECQAKLSELARELQVELYFADRMDARVDIAGSSVIDAKRIWNWGVALTSGGLGIAAVLLASGPLGWAALGVGIIGGFIAALFDDKAEKTQRARAKMEGKLRASLDAIHTDLNRRLRKWLIGDVLKGPVWKLDRNLQTATTSLFELADVQRQLAWKLNREQKALHLDLLRAAVEQLGQRGAMEQVVDVAMG